MADSTKNSKVPKSFEDLKAFLDEKVKNQTEAVIKELIDVLRRRIIKRFIENTHVICGNDFSFEMSDTFLEQKKAVQKKILKEVIQDLENNAFSAKIRIRKEKETTTFETISFDDLRDECEIIYLVVRYDF